MINKGKKYGFECKYNDAPGSSRSLRTALADLRLAQVWVVYPGEQAYRLDQRLSVIPVDRIPGICAGLTAA